MNSNKTHVVSTKIYLISLLYKIKHVTFSTTQTHCYLTGSALYFGRLPKVKIYLHIYNKCIYNWRATSTNVEIHRILEIYRSEVPYIMCLQSNVMH